MKIDAVVVSKDVPEWAEGFPFELNGRYVLLLRSKPKLQWPRWWNRLGKALGWRWLEKKNAFMRKLDGK